MPQTGLRPGKASLVVGCMVFGSSRRTGSVDSAPSKMTASCLLSGLNRAIMNAFSPSGGRPAS